MLSIHGINFVVKKILRPNKSASKCLNSHYKCQNYIKRSILSKRYLCQHNKSTSEIDESKDIQLKENDEDNLKQINKINEMPPAIIIENASKECIKMNSEEEKLIQIFENVRNSMINEEEDVDCFITGEWVRNKILGIKSNSINLTIKGIKASKFVELSLLYIKKNNHIRIPIEIIDISNPSDIKLKINGLNVSFSNIKGQYNQQKDLYWFNDAHQRDITINSLFYNIKEDRIEDYTLRGISDIIKGKISTVIDPEIKLKDKPWIIFDIFKEASSLGFKLDESIDSVIKKKTFKDSLKDEGKRLKICKSILESFKSIYPMNTLIYYFDYDLYNILFGIPNHSKNGSLKDELNKSKSFFSMKTFHNITQTNIFNNQIEKFTDDELSLLYHTSVIAPIMVERYENDSLNRRIYEYYSKTFIIDSNHINLAINMIIYSYNIDKIINKINDEIIKDNNNNGKKDNDINEEFISILKRKYPKDLLYIIQCINECIRYWPIIILYRNIYHFDSYNNKDDFNFEMNMINKLKDFGFEKIAINMNELEKNNKYNDDIKESIVLWQLDNQNFDINDVLRMRLTSK